MANRQVRQIQVLSMCNLVLLDNSRLGWMSQTIFINSVDNSHKFRQFHFFPVCVGRVDNYKFQQCFRIATTRKQTLTRRSARMTNPTKHQSTVRKTVPHPPLPPKTSFLLLFVPHRGYYLIALFVIGAVLGATSFISGTLWCLGITSDTVLVHLRLTMDRGLTNVRR